MSDNPSNKHPLLISIEDKLELVDTLYGGTAAMRDAGAEYLPKEPGEDSTNYANRLDRTVLYPAYKEAVKTNTGKLFVHDVVVENTQPSIDDLLKSIDEDGNDITDFAKQLTEEAIHSGCAYVLIDYPVMNQNSTLADERESGGRPYWVLIKQKQVLEATPIIIKGKKQLGVFRFMESIAYREGYFTVKYIDQIKQFTLINDVVTYTLYRKNEMNLWSLYDEGILTGMDAIPVTAANVNNAGFFVGSPLFYDLAEENVLNWQMRSDYNNIVHHSQVPMLQVKGVQASYDETGNKNNPIIISPNTVLEFTDPSAGASWIEVSGSAATVGQEALESSEKRMGLMSLELLSKVDSKSTATAAKIDAMESYSILQSIGKTVEQTLDKAIMFTYKYIGIEDSDTMVKINIDDAVVTGTSEDIGLLLQMFNVNLLTKETTLKEIKRRGMVSEHLDITKELVNLPTVTADSPTVPVIDDPE